MTGFTTPHTPETEPFRCLDRIWSAHGTAIVRFSSGESQAMLAPVSILAAKSPSSAAQVQIEGVAPKDPQEQVLFVSDTPAVSTIDGLLALVAGQSPDLARPRWLGLPSSLADQNAVVQVPQILQSGAQPVATLSFLHEEQCQGSFRLYSLKGDRDSTQGFEPVKTKTPEPAGNLRTREDWFRRRSRNG